MTAAAKTYLRALATGMKNGEGDPEALIINYPDAESATSIPEGLLKRILLPRQRIEGSPLFSLSPASSEKSDIDDALQLQKTDKLAQWVKSHDKGDTDKRLSLYDSMQIPGAKKTTVTAFADLVESSISNNIAYYADFVKFTLTTLAQRSQDIHYEAWNSKQDIDSLILARGLEHLSEAFPPKNISNGAASQTPDPKTDPSAYLDQALMIAYKLSLTRLLTLLYAVPSSASIDLRIWQLCSQLLALAHGETIKHDFVLKIGPCLLKGNLDIGLGGSGPRAWGPGTLGAPNEPGPLALAARQKAIPWGKIAAAAGLVTVAAAPIIVLGPIAATLGFGAAGPVAGWAAAAWQASVGVVEAGSLFAMLQSIGMAGAAATVGAPLLATISSTALTGATVVGASIFKDFASGHGMEDSLEFRFVVTITLLLGLAQA